MAHRGFWIVMATALGAALVSSLVFLAGPAAAFPGENGKIAFVRYDADAYWDDPSSRPDIWAMNPDGSGKTNLTRSPDAAESDPAVSADGSKVAFARGGVIWVMDADGSHQEPLDGYGSSPAWSPDGEKIAFVRHREVWVMDADGSDQSQLTHTRGVFPTEDSENVQPAWSPDGEKIAFRSDRNDGCMELDCYDYDVWLMNADGSGQKNLTGPYEEDGVDERSPAWSPDGEKIAFGGQLNDYCSSQLEIFEMDAGTTSYFERTNVTGDRIAYNDPACYDDAHHDSDPAYSPDGSKIAFERGGDRPRVFVMNRDGSGKTSLTEDPTLESYDPDWGPACASCPEVPPPDEGDATDPTVTGPRPAPGSEVRDRTPTIRATVRDETSELAKSDITLHVDGGAKSFSYDAGTDRLSRTTKRLSLGRHTVEITATDGAGNTATERWSFRVVKRG